MSISTIYHCISKVGRYISYIWNAKKQWFWPPRCDVLIFDASGEDLLRKYLSGKSSVTLHVRGEQVNIPVLVFSLFEKGRSSEKYFDCYLKRVQPKLVLTFIDNTLPFYRLSQRHPGIKTMFVQNGWRGYHLDVFEQLERYVGTNETLVVDYMLCFGSAIGQHYQKYISGSVVEMGALRNNNHIRSQLVTQDSIAFVSQWDPKGMVLAGKEVSQDEFFGMVDRSIMGFLVSYAQKCEKKLYVIPRTKLGTSRREDEAQYFSKIAGKPCQFLEPNESESSYHSVDAVDVVVGADSTLLYEAAARGTKTAFFSIRGTLLGVEGFDFGWPALFPDHGDFWTNTPSTERYEAIMDKLFSMSEEDWRQQMEKTPFSRLMVYDQNNSIFENKLGEVLSN